MGTTINISEYSRDVLKGLKLKKGHKNYDSALREIMHTSDIDEEELREIAQQDNDVTEKWTP